MVWMRVKSGHPLSEREAKAIHCDLRTKWITMSDSDCHEIALFVRTADINSAVVEVLSNADCERFLVLHRASHLSRQLAGAIIRQQLFHRHFHLLGVTKQFEAIFPCQPQCLQSRVGCG